ncbi:RRP15-like protein [Juglans microcarpa x Juglans regia]|uniref:RRP15-like protein n=1 Tax=Juglans microcarpa x Juglans regia TaxID=2249226 RepID=UPI001B7F7774|nr:RRP15-like protein [Juglans microcarpa x Juglans regia]
MAERTHVAEPAKVPKKRKLGKKDSKARKNTKKAMLQGIGQTKVKKIDIKMKKLFRKRAREYNSDDDDGDHDNSSMAVIRDEDFSEEEKMEVDAELDNILPDDEENGEILPGITKFAEGCRAFRLAFRSIIKKNVPDDSLGPVLSAHKKLIAEKLAEEDAERKVKVEVKKEKHLIGEKGHVKPANYFDSHEKFLILVATKGVVKLFNAVNKAQHSQKGLNPMRSKDAKAIRKRRKETFFSELGKTSKPAANTLTKGHTSPGQRDGEGPAWAPLRDNYMLTNPKLKDWDKIPEATVAGEFRRMSEHGSSDDD